VESWAWAVAGVAALFASVGAGALMAALLLGGRSGESSGCGVSVSAEAAAVRNKATAVEARNCSRRTLGIANSPQEPAFSAQTPKFRQMGSSHLGLSMN
jgi:hypothetical protein